LDQAGCQFHRRWRWVGWDVHACLFETPEGQQRISADVTVLAMGGASWARLGSDGAWAGKMDNVVPFRPANCGFAVPWSDHMTPFLGQPVKAAALSAGPLTSRGEWVITQAGIEGGGIYEVSQAVRDGAPLFVDLVPDLSEDEIAGRIAARGKRLSRNEVLRKVLRLSPVKRALLNEFGRAVPGDLAQVVKRLPLGQLSPLAMDDAISTAGGLDLQALTPDFMLRDRPGVFAAGEMLDWEAPTGGYLLTGCLATGRAAGLGAERWLADQS